MHPTSDSADGAVSPDSADSADSAVSGDSRLGRLGRPPFSIRAELLTPLGDGGTLHERDGLLRVDGRGRIAHAGRWDESAHDGSAGEENAGHRLADEGSVIDLRPLVLMPGLVDLHAHLPQLPSVALGAGLDLLTWLDRYIFPLERDFDAARAQELAPAVFRAFAAAGTTTVVVYGAVYETSLHVCFRAAEAHGIRAVIGKVMMDRLRYDPTVSDAEVLELSLRQTASLIERWHGRDGGRLQYAVTPRFAVSCSADMLRESAALASATGTYWQTHLSEDKAEIETVAGLFPDALDYTDVYERAGGLGARTIMAHAIHLSQREVSRLAATETRVAHCPSSNLFLSSGAMPLARYLEAGIPIGLGSDVAGGPDLSMFGVMRAGAYTQSGLRTMLGETRPSLAPLDWLRLGTLDGARALGLEARTGSLEQGKDADFICLDPRLTAPLPDQVADDAADLMSRLIFRARPDMVRGAWVRGRRLEA